jgi:hypothetical protein
MDNLTLAAIPFALGLTLFFGLWLAERLLAPTLDDRMAENRRAYRRKGHQPYSRTYPQTARRGR